MKKNSGGIVATVRELAEPVAAELGYEIWDVEYVKEGSDYFLRITIDSPEGITIDDCEAMHRAIDPVLDEADPIEDSYHLEISSPGIERELRTDAHIAASVGETVEVRLYAPKNGAKSFRGELLPLDADGKIRVSTPLGEMNFTRAEVASLKTCFDFGKLN